MTSASSAFDDSLEGALGLAHLALRALEAAEPTEATLPAARAVRRGIGALLDAIDGRTTQRQALDRATSTLTFAFASLGAEGDAGGEPGPGDPGGELAKGTAEDDGEASPLASAVGRAIVAARQATRLAPAEGLDAPPAHGPERSLPAWQVTHQVPRLVDVPRRSLLPPDAILLPPDPPPPRPESRALPGLDERALLGQAARLGAEAAAIEVAVKDTAARLGATDSLAATDSLGESPRGDLDVGALLADAPPLSEADFVRGAARELFEDIGMFGLQRLPLFGDDWVDVWAIENRLLASCDALIGLGAGVLADLERLARDTPAPDPMRVFAMAFVGGSLAGRDALACAERTLYAHDPHDMGIADAFGSALALVPHPQATRVLTALARAAEAPVRAASLRALARRGPVDVALLVEAGEDSDPRVVAAALPALAVARHPYALELLSQIAVRRDADAIALWEALAIAQHEDAAHAPRAGLAGALAGPAALALALVGDREDAGAVVERARSGATAALLTAVGWAGSIEGAPLLLEALGDDDLALSAARALDRLLGGGLLAKVDVDPESLESMEPVAVRMPSLQPRSPAASALAALAAQEDPSDASQDAFLLPTTDASLWRTRLAEVRAALPRGGAGLRLRRGLPYTPAASLAELAQTGQDQRPSFAERQLLARELAARSGKWSPFSAEDLVVVQQRRLAEWQSALGGRALGDLLWSPAPRA